MAIRLRMVSSMLLMVLLASLVAPALTPRHSQALFDPLTTIAAVLGLGKVTEGLVTSSIDKADGAAKDLMREAADQIDRLLTEIESTYSNALNTTLTSLDSFTGQQLAKVATLFDQINQQLMEDVAVIQQAVLDLLNQLTQMIQQTLNGLEDLIVVGVRGATFVIDKSTYNLAFIIAAVLLAIGLLMFTKLLWSGKVPGGWVRVVALLFMLSYVALFTGLLIPQARVYAITMVGQGDKLNAIGPGARIFAVTPSKAPRGAAADVMLIGANFDAGGEPRVLLNGQEIKPQAWSDTQIAVHLTGAMTKGSGPQSIAVKTADGKQSTPAILEFISPPAPAQVLSWRLVPNGQVWNYKQFGPLTLSCDALYPSMKTVAENLRVDTGWELAADPGHPGSYDTGTAGKVPEPPLGLVESTQFRNGSGQLVRNVEYLPDKDALHKEGIKITGVCLAPLAGMVISWKATYNIWGKRLLPGSGTPVSGGPCSATGTSRCGAYPTENLTSFKDGRPDTYVLMVTVRTGAGTTVDRTAQFTPGTAGQRIAVDELQIWMENNEVWVRGPALVPLPPMPVPMKPMPPKRLPIFQP